MSDPQQGQHEESTDEQGVDQLVTEDLVEEVSIDGMCGVY